MFGMMRSSFILCVVFLFFTLIAQDGEDGMSDEEFKEFIVNLIKQIIREEASKPPIVDPECNPEIVERYLRIIRTIPVTVEFDDVTLEEAAEFVRNISGLNVYVSKQARELAEGKTITLRLKEITLKNLLVLMLKMVDEELTFGIKHNVLYIGTKEELLQDTLFLEIYFIGDLIFRPPDFKAPDIALPTGDEESTP